MSDDAPPLAGVTVLDFSTLLPGPLATLMLAEAGADVIKVERADGGDPIRRVGPFTPEGISVRFLTLNRGKRSLALDLKDPDDLQRAQELARQADVVVEQFRPGVMKRLGLGFEELSRTNPGLVYCSVTGYGQTGPRAMVPGHDLNYAAEAGMLSLVRDPNGDPVLPAGTIADVGGGTYPAVINILLALARRDRTGQGTHVDIAMSENLFAFIYAGVAGGSVGSWPLPNGELLTGASPRYRLYATADGGHLAVGALEPQFWAAFCDVIALPDELRDDRRDPAGTGDKIAELIAAGTTGHWETAFADVDACVSVVKELSAAVADPHIAARELFSRRVGLADAPESIPVAHVPISPSLRVADARRDSPQLGSTNATWAKLTSDSAVI